MNKDLVDFIANAKIPFIEGRIIELIADHKFSGGTVDLRLAKQYSVMLETAIVKDHYTNTIPENQALWNKFFTAQQDYITELELKTIVRVLTWISPVSLVWINSLLDELLEVQVTRNRRSYKEYLLNKFRVKWNINGRELVWR